MINTFNFDGWFTSTGDRAFRDQVVHAASSLTRRWRSDCGRWRVDHTATDGVTIWATRDGVDRQLTRGWFDRHSVDSAFAWCRHLSSLRGA